MNTGFGEIVIFKNEDGSSVLDVHFKDDTIWLSINQMAGLFKRDKSVISRHLRSIFQTGELEKEATVAKNATVHNEGGRAVTRDIEYFNLDAIISVGYRVNSKRGTQFRIWATSVLKDHLVRGFSVNQKRLAEKGTGEMRQILSLLTNTLKGNELVNDEGRAVLGIVNRYAKTWNLLLQYDEDTLVLPRTANKGNVVMTLTEARSAINSLKNELLGKNEATELFGQERGEGLAGILGAVQQTFSGQDLYPGFAEKAANLLYFVIKDHPFSDGNKRIGTFLFLLFLSQNDCLNDCNFPNNALVALTLLTAASDPAQKDILIRLTVNLITNTK